VCPEDKNSPEAIQGLLSALGARFV
jgi:hypothetical protein